VSFYASCYGDCDTVVDHEEVVGFGEYPAERSSRRLCRHRLSESSLFDHTRKLIRLWRIVSPPPTPQTQRNQPDDPLDYPIADSSPQSRIRFDMTDPGTTLTSFTRPIIGSPEPDPSRGLFTPEEGALKLLEMIQRARRGDVSGDTGEMTGHGGGFYDWKGERVEW
jgi:hypothetical protein